MRSLPYNFSLFQEAQRESAHRYHPTSAGQPRSAASPVQLGSLYHYEKLFLTKLLSSDESFSIDFNPSRFVFSLPSSLSLSHFRYLFLNQLSGTIPPVLGNLALRQLYADNRIDFITDIYVYADGAADSQSHSPLIAYLI